MAISKKQVEHMAHLARLKFSEKEKEKFSKELSQILNFVEKLKEVDTSKVEPYFFEGKNVLRKDEIKIKSQKSPPKADQPQAEKVKSLIEQAPEKEGNFVKTKRIF